MNWATLFLIFLIALFAFFFLGQKVAFSLALASLIGLPDWRHCRTADGWASRLEISCQL